MAFCSTTPAIIPDCYQKRDNHVLSTDRWLGRYKLFLAINYVACAGNELVTDKVECVIFCNLLWRCRDRQFHYGSTLIHWGRHKIVAIFQTIFSNAFSWKNMYTFRLRFYWSLFLIFQLSIFQHWLKKISWHRPGNKPLSEIMMVCYWCIYFIIEYQFIFQHHLITHSLFVFLRRGSKLYKNTESTGPFHNMTKL